MVELTVSQVAGIIAALVFVVQLLLPIILGALLTGILKPENNLTTWSVVSRFLHSSYWPNILGSDSVASRSVHRPILAIIWSRPVILGLVGIAAIVTPIGLYDAISLDDSGTRETFHYVKDATPMGYGTPDRSELGFNRWCGMSAPLPCRGSNTILPLNFTSWSDLEDYDYTLPETVVETFTRGLSDFDDSVSSLFDIQWRTYSSRTANDGSRFLIGAYRQIDSLLLHDAMDVVEGLIVDTKSGGIGLRNHSAPSQHVHGSAWSEDILFLEPQTTCVNTNLTLEFDAKAPLFSSVFSDEVDNFGLVDRGGFVNLPTSEPMVDNDISPANAIDLHSRAYRAAWANNVYTMAFFNVTNPLPNTTHYLDSEIGKKLPLHKDYTSQYGQRDRIHTWPEFGKYLGHLPSRLMNGTVPSLVNTTGSAVSNYTNPFNISQNEFDLALTECKGTNGRVVANRSSVAISCGMVFGAPRKVDGTEAILFLPGDRLMVPIYTCASTTRASVKTVDFTYNGTGQLAGLSVANIEAKTYDNEESKPWWGVEITNLREQEANPIWGFIHPSDQNRTDLVSFQRDSLHLPGYQRHSARPYSLDQNLPGVDFHVNAMSMAYGIGASTLATPYSGDDDLGIFSRWQNLSKDAEGTAKILNLVWTNVAANAVIGTRGWHTRSASTESADNEDDGGALVRKFNRRIHYRWVYGIPAFIVLLVTLLVTVISLIFFVLGRGTPSSVKWYLNSTSMGRVYGQFIHPDAAVVQLPTAEWIRQVGVKKVSVGGVAGIR